MNIPAKLRPVTGVASICLILFFLSPNATAQYTYVNPYNLEYINISFVMADTGRCYDDATIEYKINYHLGNLNALVSCLPASTPASNLALYNVVLEIDPLLGSTKINDVINLGGNVILLDDAVMELNGTWGLDITPYSGSEIRILDNSTNTRGYPTNATLTLDTSHSISGVGNFTVVANETGNNTAVILTKNYSTGSIAIMGFLPTDRDEPFHIWRIIEKTIFWEVDLWSRLSVDNVSSDALIVSDPRHPYSTHFSGQEKTIYEWLEPEIGTALTIVPVSEVTMRGMDNTRRIIVTDYSKVTTMLPPWRQQGKDLLLVHAGTKDLEYLFGGTVDSTEDPDNYQDPCSGGNEWDDRIVGNREGEITYGYPINAHLDISTAARYLTNITYENFTVIVAHNNTDLGVISYYTPTNTTIANDSVSDIMVMGLDLSQLKSHGTLLKDRAYDWLTGTLNITGATAGRFVIPIYGGGEGPTSQEDALYDRLSGDYDVTKINISVANITDYSQTELIFVHDYGRIESLIDTWNSSGKKLFFVYEGLYDARDVFGGTVSYVKTGESGISSKYFYIKSANESEITYGYVPTAIIESQSQCVFGLNNDHAEIAQHAYSNSSYAGMNLVGSNNNDLLSYYDGAGPRVVTYGFSPNGAEYHDWKLFDRSVEWLLGTLNLTQKFYDEYCFVTNSTGTRACQQGRIGEVDLIVEINSSLDGNEAHYRGILDALTLTDGISYSTVEISYTTIANYSNTGAAIVDEPIHTDNYYYTNFLNANIGVLLPKVGAYSFISNFGGGGVLLTADEWEGTGIIYTNNSNHSYPTFGYPNDANVQVCSGCGSGNGIGFTWASLPANFVGIVGADPVELGGSPADRKYTVITNNVSYSAPVALMTFVPNTHHGDILFERSVMWLLGQLDVAGTKTKDVVFIVYNEDSLTSGEQVIEGWLNSSFSASRYSTLDISKVMASELWGTSRYVAYEKDLIQGVVNYWHNLSYGINFLGESVYDAADALDVASIGTVDPLDDEGYSGGVNGTVVNNHTILGSAQNNSIQDVATAYTDTYAVANLNTSLFTQLLKHTDCTETCPEILLAAHESVGNMTLFGINPLYATNTSRDLAINAINWVYEVDTVPPSINTITISPLNFSDTSTINILVSVTDDRCIGGRCVGVYNVTLNYSTNLSDDSAWTIITLGRWANLTDFWEGSLGPLYGKTYMIYQVLAIDTTGNIGRSVFYYYGLPESIPPQVTNVRYQPYMPTSLNDITVNFTTDEFANSTLYWRVNESAPWTPVPDTGFSLEHSITISDASTSENTTYEYWIMACDFLNNCVNETNYDDYFLFCIEPGCEKVAPQILSVEPSNATTLPGSVTSLLLNITTDEWAECRYSSVSTAFYNMSNVFNSTFKTNHSTLIDLDTNENDVHIRCRDMFGTNNTEDYYVYFFVDAYPPDVTLGLPADLSTNNGSTVVFSYNVSDNRGIDRCSLYLNHTIWYIEKTSPYVTNGTSNTFTVSLDDFTYPWNVRCWDIVNNSAYAPSNYTVTVNSSIPVLAFGSETCSDNAEDGALCYPTSLTIGSIYATVHDGFDVTNITDWNTTTYGSGVLETRSTYKHAGNRSLFSRTEIPTDLAYLSRNVSLEYPYIIDLWMYVPSGQTINGTGAVYVTQFDNPENAEIALQLADDNYGLDVNDNGIWTYDVVNLTADTWINIKASMINTTHWKLFVNEGYIGTYGEKSSAVPNAIVLGDFKDDTGAGSSYYDDIYVLNSRIAVLDTDNHRVQVFELEGGYESKFGSFGSNESMFYYPEGIEISDMGYIYVADSVNDKVKVFWHNGTFKFEITGLNDPRDVAISDSLIYVADRRNDRVQVFNMSGHINATIGATELNRPEGVAVGDKVYVADTGNNSIAVFNLNGSLETIVRWNFSQPGDIALDRNFMHVIDTGNNQVKVFRLNGSFYRSFGGYHKVEIGKFDGPKGITTGGDYIYVADTENSRIQVFSIYYDRALPYVLPTPMIPNITITGFNEPSGIFVHSLGDIYVADKKNDTIQIFNSSGSRIKTIGNNNTLNWPSDVSVDGAGRVYVADTSNLRVSVFWPNATQYGSITGLSQLQGVAVWYQGEVYVADTNNHSVSVYHPDWSLNYVFGSQGNDSGQFQSPMDLTVGSDGRIYIVDRFNNRIQVLSANGTFNMTIGNLSAGNESGQFDDPHSVAVDQNGMIHVADTGNSRVQILNSDGTFNFSFTADGTLNRPEGIAVGPTGEIYVSDTGNDRVLVFDGYPITDLIPPQISGPEPANNTALWPFTASLTFNISTDEITQCKYAGTAGVSFTAMTNTFGWTNSVFHSETVTGLTNNNTYDYYIRCNNPWGLNTSGDYHLRYSVSYPQVVINEFMPNPVDVEWIEIYNRGETSVNLNSWTLSYNDSLGSANYTLDNVLGRFGYSVRYGNDTGISLNDSYGSIWLLDPNGSVVDNMTYNATIFNASWSYIPLNVSVGRMPDGADNWTYFVNSSRGASNAGVTTTEITLTLGWNLMSVPLIL